MLKSNNRSLHYGFVLLQKADVHSCHDEEFIFMFNMHNNLLLMFLLVLSVAQSTEAKFLCI